MFRKIISFFQKATFGRSGDENIRHKEYILNVLLISSIVLLLTAFIIDLSHFIFGDPVIYQNNSISLLIVFFILLFFLFLYLLSRKGFSFPVSYLLISVFLLLAAYMGLSWGVDVIASLLFYVLAIVMAGILIGARFAFFSTSAVIFLILGTDYVHRSGIVEANRYWRSEPWTETDTIIMAVIFFIIAIVSWLSNREIEKSLKRAIRSEAELKLERDLLEVKVEERAAELKKAQIEQASQLYHFAEFGKLSSSLFHDLVNPLAAASLNIERMQDNSAIEKIDRSYLDKASISIKRMENFIVAVRKQMMNRRIEKEFLIGDEIRSVIQILNYKSKRAGVSVFFEPPFEISVYGDPNRFSQVILNLVVNAIDSYASPYSDNGERNVEIILSEGEGMIRLSVRDYGCGIPLEIREKIFEPFFTTKGSDEGIGIGLSLTKGIVENDFHGDIACVSEDGKGSVFSISFPKSER